MGTATRAMRIGEVSAYTMDAFIFDVLVKVECSHRLVDRSDLHFRLTFEEETSFGLPTKYPVKEMSDKVLDRILELGIHEDHPVREIDKKMAIKMAHEENRMNIVRPRTHSFKGFKDESTKLLEALEEIFHSLVSPYGSVMELSFGQKVRI